MITHIKITDMLCFKSYEVTLPAVCIVRGHNGKGKSSLQRCIKYPYELSHDPKMIRDGAEAGEIVQTLSDGTQVRAVANRKPGKTIVERKPLGGGKWVLAKDFVSQVSSALSYDPMKDLDNSDRDELAALLTIMPLTLDVEELRSIVGELVPDVDGLKLYLERKIDGDVLARIEEVYDAVFKARTAVNRDKLTYSKHAQALLESVPEDAEGKGGWDAHIKDLEMQKTFAETRERQEMDAAAERERQAIEEIQARHSDDCREKLTDIEAEIASLRSQIGVLEQSKKTIAAEVEAAMNKEIGERRQVVRGVPDHRAVIAALETDITVAKGKQKAYDKATGTRESAKVASESAARSAARSDTMTAALDALKDLKIRTADQIKIPGLVISDGAIRRENDLLPYSSWNTADKVVYRFRRSILARPDLPFVVCDSIGDLDPETLDGVTNSAARYADEFGVQWIFGQPTDGDLRVDSLVA